MRTKIPINRDVLNRDTSWITQEIIETYAGALNRSESHARNLLTVMAQSDPVKFNVFMEVVAIPYIHMIERLQIELLDEFGEEHFVGPSMTKAQLRKAMEDIINNPKATNKEKVDAAAKLSDLNGWTTKPADKAVDVAITNFNGPIKFDKANPAEGERLYMAIAGAALAR